MFCKKKGTNLSKTPKKLNLNFSKLQSDLMSIFNFFEIIKNRITVQVFFAVAVGKYISFVNISKGICT